MVILTEYMQLFGTGKKIVKINKKTCFHNKEICNT